LIIVLFSSIRFLFFFLFFLLQVSQDKLVLSYS
jgi:hypothetical protein